jgi:hypothetical protein
LQICALFGRHVELPWRHTRPVDQAILHCPTKRPVRGAEVSSQRGKEGRHTVNCGRWFVR